MGDLRSRVIRLASAMPELRPHLLPLLRGASMKDGKLQCDMEESCTESVTHVDNKGWAYCTKHGEQRKRGGTPCRKLKPGEIKKLEQGQTIKY